MSVSIEVCFEHDVELLAVTERLRDLPLKVSKRYHAPGARFKRVYLKGETHRPPEPGSAPDGRCNGPDTIE